MYDDPTLNCQHHDKARVLNDSIGIFCSTVFRPFSKTDEKRKFMVKHWVMGYLSRLSIFTDQNMIMHGGLSIQVS